MNPSVAAQTSNQSTATTTIPRGEYPRPMLVRDRWQSLNGPWRFAFDPDLIGEQMGWQKPGSPYPKELTITVPFPWESRLSGVASPDYKGAAWYEREISVPDEWQGDRIYLNFGAVDWQARVWVNGQLVGEHANGYLPFSCDVTEHVRPGGTATVTVRAYDVADATTPVGKQVPRWYTYSSGIWQSVWLEGRPADHLHHVHALPDVANEQVICRMRVNIAEAGRYSVRLSSPDDTFPPLTQQVTLSAGRQEVDLVLPVPQPRLWSPDAPHLYPLQVELTGENGGTDQVESYFGMRTVGRATWGEKPYEYILLNGEPVYLRGALDQAFHPDGLHAYPSDEAIRNDVQLAKDLGLNMLRCHIKVNDPRYYYWADRLGVLMMYDLPCTAMDSPQSRRNWEATLRGALARDINHPSIMAWVLFNETWGLDNHHTAEGQEWVRHMLHMTQELDPTRLVEDNSPCLYDHVETDINSWHFYINDYDEARRHIQRVVDETYPGSTFNYIGENVQGHEPLMNSEYAGISASMGDLDIAWSFKYLTTDLRRHDKICGYVYTELTDIEWEHNGFVNYDRSGKEYGYDAFVPGMGVADLNGADLVGLDAPPCQTLAPGTRFAASLFVSHYGPPLTDARVRWQLNFVAASGEHLGVQRTLHEQTLSVALNRFAVTQVGTLEVEMPAVAGLATIALWLEDDQGQVHSRNYVNIEVRAEASPPVEESDLGWFVRFAPGDFRGSSWTRPTVGAMGQKFAATGAGWVEYALELPPECDPTALQKLTLYCEMGARAGRAKIDWPRRIQRTDYPQTEAKKHPSDVTITINNVIVGAVHLPDDPADARGVLSHHRGVDPGSYGYLQEVTLDGEVLARVCEALQTGEKIVVRFDVPSDGDATGGLALYGETVGMYPFGPTLTLTK